MTSQMENIDYIPNWAKKAIIYHIYPLGFFNAPQINPDDGKIINRMAEIRKYYSYFEKLGINVIQFGPVFESVSHGYNTIDYLKVDSRLASNQLFKEIVEELHACNIKVILDGVFNHTSRNFFSFKDIQQNRENSAFLKWYFIDFTKNNPYNDGFDYTNWEGHYSLVKLNLKEHEVKKYLFNAVEYWMREIKIDGWRLDVAYLISNEFWQEFRQICKKINQDCFLIGEMIHGPYSQWIGSDRLDAGTGYQVHKSIWSALNENNMYELKAVLENSFHPNWGQAKDILLINFLGNHDTTRIRSRLINDRLLVPAYLILFTLNGVPKIYYGDEIGMKGAKTTHSDEEVRKPMIPPHEVLSMENNTLLEIIRNLIRIRKENHALIYGNLISLFADNINGNLIAYLRQSSQETLLIIINGSSKPVSAIIPLWNLNFSNDAKFVDILNPEDEKLYIVNQNQLNIPYIYPYWGKILLLRN